MKREIEFRGQRCSDGKWVYGYYVESKTSWRGHKPHKSWIVSDAISNGGFFNILGRYAVKDDTVGQFTGLLDKNGKKIYEGDILRVKEYKNLCWDLSKSQEERDEMMHTFALDDLKGELDKEYISAVAFEEGTYCLSSNGDYNDMYLSCLFGDMNGSLPIFDFEVIGNIHDNFDLMK